MDYEQFNFQGQLQVPLLWHTSEAGLLAQRGCLPGRGGFRLGDQGSLRKRGHHGGARSRPSGPARAGDQLAHAPTSSGQSTNKTIITTIHSMVGLGLLLVLIN